MFRAFNGRRHCVLHMVFQNEVWPPEDLRRQDTSKQTVLHQTSPIRAPGELFPKLRSQPMVQDARSGRLHVFQPMKPNSSGGNGELHPWTVAASYACQTVILTLHSWGSVSGLPTIIPTRRKSKMRFSVNSYWCVPNRPIVAFI